MTANTITAVLLLSLLSVLTTWIGVALALRLRREARAIAVGMGFSGGMMVVISLAELVPRALAEAGVSAALPAVAAGAGLIALLNLLIPHIHLVEGRDRAERGAIRATYLIVLGLVLHDVPEGFAMANAYIASPGMGVLVALGIALHNVPEEFAMAVPAVTLRSKKFLFGAAVLSALAEPVGAVIGLVAVGIAPRLNAHFMAFAAGAMLFVSIHELVPMARRYRHVSAFVLGISISALVYAGLAAATARLG